MLDDYLVFEAQLRVVQQEYGFFFFFAPSVHGHMIFVHRNFEEVVVSVDGDLQCRGGRSVRDVFDQEEPSSVRHADERILVRMD